MFLPPVEAVLYLGVGFTSDLSMTQAIPPFCALSSGARVQEMETACSAGFAAEWMMITRQ